MSSSQLSSLAHRSRDQIPPADFQHFLDSFLYGEEAVLIDEITRMDREAGLVEGVFDTTRSLPFSAAQRVSELHPAHVSGAELVMVTGSLGCLDAYFFHGYRWDEGWAGFGNRIHRADFKQLARIGRNSQDRHFDVRAADLYPVEGGRLKAKDSYWKNVDRS